MSQDAMKRGLILILSLFLPAAAGAKELTIVADGRS